MNQQPRFPDFFVLGAAKSGTTSLHAWLAQHSEIAMSKPKEPFFFEAEYERGVSFYWQRYFNHWAGERLLGDARHRNLYLPYVPARICASAADARLVVILRNPVRRALSHWWHWFARGRDDLYFEAALERDLARIAAGREVSTPAEIAAYSAQLSVDGRGVHRTYLDTGYYAIQLQRYFALFPRDRFKIMIFEEVVTNPQRHCADLFEFLGVNPSEAGDISYDVFANHAGSMIPRVAARWTAMRTHAILRGGDPPSGPPIVTQGPKMSRSIEAWLVAHYAPHNEALEDLLGRRLPWD
jgi:Sulfotransferase domain